MTVSVSVSASISLFRASLFATVFMATATAAIRLCILADYEKNKHGEWMELRYKAALQPTGWARTDAGWSEQWRTQREASSRPTVLFTSTRTITKRGVNENKLVLVRMTTKIKSK